MVLEENMINLWSLASADPSHTSKWWGEPGEGSGERSGLPSKGQQFCPGLFVRLSLLIHPRNIHKISSMCRPLDIQFIQSCLHPTRLNVVPCSCSSELFLLRGKCPESGRGDVALGNGEEMTYNALLKGEDNWQGLIQLETGVHWDQRNKQRPELSWV